MPDRFELPPETVTPGQIYIALQSVNSKLAVISAQGQVQTQRMDRLELELAGLLSAWKAGGVLLSLAKVVAAIGTAVAMAYAAVKWWG